MRQLHVAEGHDLAGKSQQVSFSYLGIVRANKSEVNNQMSRDNEKEICEEGHKCVQ
jgi:hypothetical protein